MPGSEVSCISRRVERLHVKNFWRTFCLLEHHTVIAQSCIIKTLTCRKAVSSCQYGVIGECTSTGVQELLAAVDWIFYLTPQLALVVNTQSSIGLDCNVFASTPSICKILELAFAITDASSICKTFKLLLSGATKDVRFVIRTFCEWCSALNSSFPIFDSFDLAEVCVIQTFFEVPQIISCTNLLTSGCFQTCQFKQVVAQRVSQCCITETFGPAISKFLENELSSRSSNCCISTEFSQHCLKVQQRRLVASSRSTAKNLADINRALSCTACKMETELKQLVFWQHFAWNRQQ